MEGVWQGDAAAVLPPSPDPGFIGRPLFTWFGEPIVRGTGFILDWKGRPYLVSCYHVFGKNNKSTKLMREKTVLAEAAGRLPVPGEGATHRDDCDARAEITIIPVTRLAATGKQFKLAPAPPRIGQPAWLYSLAWEDEISRRLSGNDQFAAASYAPRLTKGPVTRSSNHALELGYGDIDIEMTSGAPILDQNGDVIGVNTGLCKRGNVITGLAAPHQALHEAFLRYAPR